MNNEERYVNQPVRSLQTMLQAIALCDKSCTNVIPDGMYGQKTMQAVSAFQRSHGIPVTGVTDQTTWDAIVLCYENALEEIQPCCQIEVPFCEELQREDPCIYLLQAVLKVLSLAYGSILEPPISGVMDGPTQASISSFQALCGMGENGICCRHTWMALSRQFPLAMELIRRGEGCIKR